MFTEHTEIQTPSVAPSADREERASQAALPQVVARSSGEVNPLFLPAPLSMHDQCVARIKLAKARMQVRQSPWPVKPAPVRRAPHDYARPCIVYSTAVGPFAVNSPRPVYAAPIGPQQGIAAIGFIVRTVCRAHGQSYLELMGEGRRQELVFARHECFWRLRKMGLSLPEIGRRMSRDHQTVMHGIKMHQKRLDQGFFPISALSFRNGASAPSKVAA